MHKCPSEPCDDCWEEAKFVGKVLIAIGIGILGAILTSCASIQTSDCKRDVHNRWVCKQK